MWPSKAAYMRGLALDLHASFPISDGGGRDILIPEERTTARGPTVQLIDEGDIDVISVKFALFFTLFFACG